jgi:hypothetical protein
MLEQDGNLGEMNGNRTFKVSEIAGFFMNHLFYGDMNSLAMHDNIQRTFVVLIVVENLFQYKNLKGLAFLQPCFKAFKFVNLNYGMTAIN